jgi:hypothetical protein
MIHPIGSGGAGQPISQFTTHLTGKNKALAERTITKLFDSLAGYHLRHGNPFKVDMRRLSEETGINLKRVQKWMRRFVAAGALILHNQGRWLEECSSYSLGLGWGTVFIKQQETRQTTSRLQGIHYTESGSKDECVLSDTTYCESIPCNCVAVAISPNKSCNTVPHPSLDDLDNLEEQGSYKDDLGERLMAVPCDAKEVRRRRRAKSARFNDYEARLMLQEMRQQCERERSKKGSYQYPIHPEVYDLLQLGCGDNEDDERWGQIVDASGKVRRQYCWLRQPLAASRPRCPECAKSGRQRVCRLYFMRSVRFGAIKYRCGLCGWLGDLWKDFPVFPRKTNNQYSYPIFGTLTLPPAGATA